MSALSAKAVVVFILLALGLYYFTTSKLLPFVDNSTGLSHVFDCNGVLRKIRGRREGGSKCETLVTIDRVLIPYRGVRSRYLLSPPPPPSKSRQTAMKSFAPPPQIE